MIQVDVTDGVVRLTGELERKSMLALIQPAVRAVEGVIDVEAQLSYAIDDTRLPVAADLTDLLTTRDPPVAPEPVLPRIRPRPHLTLT
jgi:hypothetical protein